MADFQALKREIESLSPPARLRLAADLLERKSAKMAYVIAESVVLELGAALALAELRGDR